MTNSTKSTASIGLRLWRQIRPWLLGWLTCTLIALFLASQWFVNPNANPGHWPHVLMHYISSFYVWGLLTVGIVRITAKVGLDRQHWFWYTLIYLAIGLGFAILHILLTMMMFRVFGFLTGDTTNVRPFNLVHFLGFLHSNLIIFAMITSFCLVVIYYRKFQDRESRTHKLETQLAQAQLSALQSQLQPHFLFNTLNAISALISEQPEMAERMIVRLSDLLRSTLDNRLNQTIDLVRELELTRLYLEIEKVRFGDRLTVVEEIDAKATTVQVPTFVLQPLVENAMMHGVAQTPGTCIVTISAELVGARIRLSVTDDGPGTKTQANGNGRGLGLNNTRNRLRHLYPEAFYFSAEPLNEGGYRVIIEFPAKIEKDRRESMEESS